MDKWLPRRGKGLNHMTAWKPGLLFTLIPIFFSCLIWIGGRREQNSALYTEEGFPGDCNIHHHRKQKYLSSKRACRTKQYGVISWAEKGDLFFPCTDLQRSDSQRGNSITDGWSKNRILSKRFGSDQWTVAPVQRVANQWVAWWCKFHSNHLKDNFWSPTCNGIC